MKGKNIQILIRNAFTIGKGLMSEYKAGGEVYTDEIIFIMRKYNLEYGIRKLEYHQRW